MLGRAAVGDRAGRPLAVAAEHGDQRLEVPGAQGGEEGLDDAALGSGSISGGGRVLDAAGAHGSRAGARRPASGPRSGRRPRTASRRDRGARGAIRSAGSSLSSTTRRARPTESRSSRSASAGPRRPRPRARRPGAPRAAGARAQHVEADARDDGGQPAAQVLDRARVGARELEPRLLHGVVGLGGRAEHAVRDQPEVGAVLLEGGGETGHDRARRTSRRRRCPRPRRADRCPAVLEERRRRSALMRRGTGRAAELDQGRSILGPVLRSARSFVTPRRAGQPRSPGRAQSANSSASVAAVSTRAAQVSSCSAEAAATRRSTWSVHQVAEAQAQLAQQQLPDIPPASLLGASSPRCPGCASETPGRRGVGRRDRSGISRRKRSRIRVREGAARGRPRGRLEHEAMAWVSTRPAPSRPEQQRCHVRPAAR